MVLSGTLRVLLGLLCLCLRGTEALDVDQNALARIISYIQTEYSPSKDRQYAVAIYVPVGYCSGDLKPKHGEFLKHDNPDAAIKAMNGIKGVYEGRELIAATQINDKGTSKLHSEYLLLKDPEEDKSPMMKLLNKYKIKDRCVIFYTYNSPCIGTCLNKGGDRHILGVLSTVEGPKAFVYNKIFKHDTKEEDLDVYLKTIDKEIKLYRCYAPTKTTPEHDHDHSRQATFGERSRQATFGERSRQATFGERSRQATFGDRSRQATFGDQSRRDRSRETPPRDRTRSPTRSYSSYECHACVESDDVAHQCLNNM